MPLRALTTLGFVSLTLLLTAGCGIGTTPTSSSSAASLVKIQGKVHGGQQPIAGGSIQLYAANATTLMGASTPMLTPPVTTDADGNFNITGLYTCPTGDALIYLVGTGGNPGLSGSTMNSGIALMSLLGRCSDVVAQASTLFVYMDEITTVVAVQALAPFMSDYAHVGSGPTSVNGVGEAFESATGEIDFSTGNFQGGGNLELPIVTIDTLADIIAACVNTSGGGGACSTLYANTGGTSDTVAAALYMLKNPGQNTTPLYNLITAAAPFQPYFTSVPTDFTATVGYTLPSFVQGGALDSNGHIWLYYGGYNYAPGTDTSTDSVGYLAVYDNNFNQLFTITPGTPSSGGLYYPSSFSADASGHVFAINSNNTISEFDGSGNAISPAAGWPSGQSSTFSPSGPGNNYITSDSQAGPIVIDAQGNIWGGVGYNSSQTQGSSCYFELNSSGASITPAAAPTYCAAVGLTTVETAAVDGQGSAWALGSTSISKVNSSGVLSATAPVSQGCFYPSSSSAPGQDYSDETLNITYDRVHNQLWGYSELGAGAITDLGVAVFCDAGAATLPVIPKYSSATTTPGAAFTAGDLVIESAALDGAGNLWFVTGGLTANGVVGSSAGTFTGSASYASYLGEISPSGILMTPYNAAQQSYGLQPTGFGAQATAAATETKVPIAGPSVSLLGIDNSGNIWAVDSQSYKILKITSLASPNSVNYQ